MQEVIVKKDPNIILEKNIKEFLNPRYIFVPIEEGFKLKVNDNDYVYKNDIVAMDKKSHSLHSSISGRVLGVKEMPFFTGKMIPSLVIENDFRENIRVRKSSRKYISDCTRKELLEILKDTSLCIKNEYLAEKLATDNRSIIINGVESEPYFENQFFTFMELLEEILETVDMIATTIKAPKVLLVLKSTKVELINKLVNILGTYPNIEMKLVNDAYQNSLDEVLKKTYSLPDSLVLNIEEVRAIYETVKRTVPITEEFITVVGNAVSPSCVLKVKNYSLLSEAFVSHFNFTKEEVDVYLNGMLKGEKITSLKLVIDSNIDGILVMEKSREAQEKCIKCGLCSKHCPMGLSPKYVYDHGGRVKKEYYDTCIQCGLCNFVCPSNIDLKRLMKGRQP